LPEEINVRISVFNIFGEKVNDLVNEQKTSGTHTINFNADNLASGIYFYRIEAKTLSGVDNFNTVNKCYC